MTFPHIFHWQLSHANCSKKHVCAVRRRTVKAITELQAKVQCLANCLKIEIVARNQATASRDIAYRSVVRTGQRTADRSVCVPWSADFSDYPQTRWLEPFTDADHPWIKTTIATLAHSTVADAVNPRTRSGSTLMDVDCPKIWCSRMRIIRRRRYAHSAHHCTFVWLDEVGRESDVVDSLLFRYRHVSYVGIR